MVEQFRGNCLNGKDGKNDQYCMKACNCDCLSFLQNSTLYCMLFTFSQGCSLPFPRDEMFTFPQESFSFPLGFVYASPVINICYLFPGILFTFPQGYCLPFPKDIVYLSSGCYLSFPRDIVYLSPWICLPFPRDVVYLCPGMSFTFPQGESQAGSPGLLAFQSAKSRSDFLSPGF